MELLIIDAQGGGIGRQLAASVKKSVPGLLVTAAGSNSAATAAMLLVAPHSLLAPQKTILMRTPPSWRA